MKLELRQIAWLALAATVFSHAACNGPNQSPAQQQQPATQKPNQGPGSQTLKKTVTGTVEEVNPKARTIAVKTAAAQQIQAQTASAKPAQELVFAVSEQTAIAARGASKGGGEVAKKPQDPFGLLAAGQAVRVVYEEPAAEPPAGKLPAKDATAAEPAKKAGPAPSDDEPPVPTPVEEHKAEPQMSEIAPAAARPLLAISIDILAAKPAQAKSIDP